MVVCCRYCVAVVAVEDLLSLLGWYLWLSYQNSRVRWQDKRAELGLQLGLEHQHVVVDIVRCGDRHCGELPKQ